MESGNGGNGGNIGGRFGRDGMRFGLNGKGMEWNMVHDMDFLSTNFDSGLVSPIINSIIPFKFRRQKSSLIFFSGALNSSSPV